MAGGDGCSGLEEVAPMKGDEGVEYSRHWTNAVAGLSGGFVSAMAMHPLDVVTTRFQVATSRFLAGLRSSMQESTLA